MDCPIGDLVVHLMERCHRPLGARLLNLETVIDMVKESHTDDADDRTERIRGAYLSLRSDLLPHLLLEEDILFPCIISGKDTGSVDLIEDLQNQHKVIAKKMKTLAASVSKLPMSENTCEGRQTLYTVVKALEADVSCHIHFENDVFYVRVLRETWKRRNLEKQHAHHYR
jgi:regulator of cell morphogenesis and NO signaling